MRFWDASAIVPLLIEEPSSDAMRALFEADSDLTVWWSADVECASAVMRRARAGLAEVAIQAAEARLVALAAEWRVVQPSAILRDSAIQLLRRHDLRAADALQLAGALQAAEFRPSTLPFVCLDARLGAAATAEGFTVIIG